MGHSRAMAVTTEATSLAIQRGRGATAHVGTRRPTGALGSELGHKSAVSPRDDDAAR